MEQPQKLKEKILSAPDSPGVYLMRDNRGKVLYVGKANSLRKRLSSYLTRDLSSKTIALMSKVVDVEFRLSPNEAMALLLEAALIHRFKPRYNISLRDDKSFPFVKISGEEFPSISITRKKDDPLGRYLGPYTNVKLLKNAKKISGAASRTAHAGIFPGKVAYTAGLTFVLRLASARSAARSTDRALIILF